MASKPEKLSLIRLYVDAPLADGAPAPLDGGQTHYLRTVMRRKEGDAIALFNARDGEFEATIARLGKKDGAAQVVRRRRAPVTDPDLWLLFAPVKRAALEHIVQKATELGVSRLAPVTTERTVVSRVKEDRLTAIATEAAEQCGRLSAPEVAPLEKLKTALDAWPAGRRLVFCDEAGDDPAAEWGGRGGRAAPAFEALQPYSGAGASWAVLIGPEGGFSPRERARLRGLEFVVPVTLGSRILRADTAAVAALTLWQAALGDWRSG
ncbi:MAG: 16S rRNA (uracil(1498)-N(3))-methyltransferase [Parvularculaceae bacterium]